MSTLIPLPLTSEPYTSETEIEDLSSLSVSTEPPPLSSSEDDEEDSPCSDDENAEVETEDLSKPPSPSKRICRRIATVTTQCCPTCDTPYNNRNHGPFTGDVCNHTQCLRCWNLARVKIHASSSSSTSKPKKVNQYCCQKCKQNNPFLFKNREIHNLVIKHGGLSVRVTPPKSAKTSNVSSLIFCDICKNVGATAACSSCLENTCDACWTIVHHSIARRCHEKKKSCVFSDQFCVLHPSMPYMFTAVDGSRFMCSLCLLSNPVDEPYNRIKHQSRTDASDIKHLREDAVAQLDDIERQFNERKAAHKTYRAHNQQQMSADIKVISDLEDRAIKRTRETYKRIRTHIEKQHTRVSEHIKENTTRLTTSLSTLKKSIETSKDVQESADPLKIVRAFPDLKKELSSVRQFQPWFDKNKQLDTLDSFVYSGWYFLIPGFSTWQHGDATSNYFSLNSMIKARLVCNIVDNNLCVFIDVDRSSFEHDDACIIDAIIRVHNAKNTVETLHTTAKKAFFTQRPKLQVMLVKLEHIKDADLGFLRQDTLIVSMIIVDCSRGGDTINIRRS